MSSGTYVDDAGYIPTSYGNIPTDENPVGNSAYGASGAIPSSTSSTTGSTFSVNQYTGIGAIIGLGAAAILLPEFDIIALGGSALLGSGAGWSYGQETSAPGSSSNPTSTPPAPNSIEAYLTQFSKDVGIGVGTALFLLGGILIFLAYRDLSAI